MKKRIGLIAVITAITIVVCLVIWRLWPHTLSDLIYLDEDSVTSLWTQANVRNFESEKSFDDTYYSIDITSQQNSNLREILEILDTSDYQQDFRNLLPWDVITVHPDKNYDGTTVQLQYVWGNGSDEYVSITFLSSSIITVFEGGESGFRIYHPTNQETIYDLVEYLKTNGTTTIPSYQ